MKKSVKLFLKIIGIIFLILGIGFLIFIAFINYVVTEAEYKIYRREKFDSAKWLQLDGLYEPRNHIDFGCERGKMYHDLQKNYLKKGMSKKEVENLLGQAYVEVTHDKNKCILYYLGQCGYYPPDDALIICFNKNNDIGYFLLTKENKIN